MSKFIFDILLHCIIRARSLVYLIKSLDSEPTRTSILMTGNDPHNQKWYSVLNNKVMALPYKCKISKYKDSLWKIILTTVLI